MIVYNNGRYTITMVYNTSYSLYHTKLVYGRYIMNIHELSWYIYTYYGV